MARLPSTWGRGKPAAVLDRDPVSLAQGSAREPPHDGRVHGHVELTVKRWTRFGHDRLYVNRGETSLGYLDLKTDRLVVEDEDVRADVLKALVDYDSDR